MVTYQVTAFSTEGKERVRLHTNAEINEHIGTTIRELHTEMTGVAPTHHDFEVYPFDEGWRIETYWLERVITRTIARYVP